MAGQPVLNSFSSLDEIKKTHAQNNWVTSGCFALLSSGVEDQRKIDDEYFKKKKKFEESRLKFPKELAPVTSLSNILTESGLVRS